MTAKTFAGIILFTLVLSFEIIIGIYVIFNITDTKIYLLNPPEEPETLSFTLNYPSKSVLFPILPINSTEYVYLNIQLNYFGEIAERQPVNLTVSGFMTKLMANKTDTIFVEFTGAVPYYNGTSSYGPWFSGAVLSIDSVDEEGRFILKNDTVTIVWNVQGYYDPVVVIRDKYTGNDFFQEYTDFPVYVIGYGDFQQAKANRINIAISFAAILLSVLLSIDILWKLFDSIRDKSDSSKTDGRKKLKSSQLGNNFGMESPKSKNNCEKNDLKQKKKALKKMYKDFHYENWQRSQVIWVVNSILITGSLLVAFQTRINFLSSLVSIILVSIANILYLTTDIEIMLTYKIMDQIRGKLDLSEVSSFAKNEIIKTLWYPLRKGAAYLLFSSLISAYLFQIFNNILVLLLTFIIVLIINGTIVYFYFKKYQLKKDYSDI